MINFSQILTINTPYLAHEGEVWGVYCEFKPVLNSTFVNIDLATNGSSGVQMKFYCVKYGTYQENPHENGRISVSLGWANSLNAHVKQVAH